MPAFLCVYLCRLCLSVSVLIRIYVSECLCFSVCLYMPVSVYVRMCQSQMFIRVYVFLCLCLCVCLYLPVSVYVCTCI